MQESPQDGVREEPRSLLAGVGITRLQPHHDGRGCFTEIFRREWNTHINPVQWNVVRSRARTLRGVHLHLRHWDYLTVLEGELCVGLRDLRPESVTHGQVELLTLSPETACAITIPPRVAHGFLSLVPSIHLYGVSKYWDRSDELGCRWDDPQLGIAWPLRNVVLSECDEAAGSFAQLALQAQNGAHG